MDTVVTKKDDFNNPANKTKILKSFSFRKSTDRPSVDQFKKKGNLCINAKNLDSKRNSKNPKNLIIGHLNVNSLKNKFAAVKKLIKIELTSV